MIVRHCLLLAILTAAPIVADRQDRVPEFEAAMVKANRSGQAMFTFTYQGNTFNATNVTLRMLIRNAYQVQDSQILGGPGWVNTDRFDIVAKADLSSSPAFPVQQPEGPSRLQLMMQALLAERFKLAVHKEDKGQAIYALIVARSDGRLGDALRPSTADCAQTRCGISMGIGTLTLGGGSLFQLANSLSNLVGRPVVDRTGLTGHFDLTLTWTPEQGDGPSIYTAVREQLGLKLDAQKGGAAALVIDGVEHPTAN